MDGGGITMKEAGFYKLDNTELLYGPNFVLNTGYNLYKEQKDTYSYPIDGWYWFSEENEARLFFGLPLIEPEPPTPGLDV
jgi:hypothetical protein